LKTVGIALSGGGARGVAHLGVLKALKEFGVIPDMLSGSSAGAMVAAFYAAGHTDEKIIDITTSSRFFSIFHLHIGKSGLFDMGVFESIYLEHFPQNTFESLSIPIHIAATDIVLGESKYFSSGNLAKAVMASSCVPTVFEPVEHEGKMLLDGGILNNLPVEPLVGKCDKIIAVHVNNMSREPESVSIKNLPDRTFHLAIQERELAKKGLCQLFIEPTDMGRFGMFDTNHAMDIYNYAYEFTKGMKTEIEAFAAI
jgi:NTE family protein